MKRIVFVLLSALMSFSAFAVVAPKTPYPYTQPDGTVIILVNHGDEFYNWTTCNDQIVEKDEQGFYRPVSSTGLHRQRAAASRSIRQQARQLQRAAAGSRLGMGDKHFMVLLIEFDDLAFTTPNARDAFERMLNESGYSENGGTGSARDFYMDNSAGAFTPTFDVYGPVKVEKEYAYYGKKSGNNNDAHPDELLYDACTLLDDTVDFSQYDLDHDGYVDNIFFYFAGHNEAEGGGTDTIWPHQWYLAHFNGYFDNVRVWSYACSSEFKGSSGENMAGIGTFVHEFGHVIGLPDFYDTDYAENGSASHPQVFSTMADGNYLNESRTPCCFTSVERQMLGWMGDFQEIDLSGEYNLNSLSSNALPFFTKADVDGEQFIYEYRDATGWDSYLPEGMVVYHMDQSSNICHDNVTAQRMWQIGGINNYAAHPCFRIIPAVKGSARPPYMVFPGEGNVTSFTPVPWSGEDLPCSFSDIRLEDNQVKMTVSVSNVRRVYGYIKDSNGHPLAGARIVLSVETPSSAPASISRPPRLHQIRPSGQQVRYQASSDENGAFEILLDENDETPLFRIDVSCEGFIEQARTITFDRRQIRCQFNLRPLGSPAHSDLKKFDLFENEDFSRIGYGKDSESKSIMGAVYFSSDELKPYAGMKVKSLSFVIGTDVESAHVLIDTDSERLLVREAPEMEVGQFEEVDVSDQNIFISASSGMYFGYAVKEPEDGYPLVYQNIPADNGLYYSAYKLDAIAWTPYQGDYALLIAVTLEDEAASRYVTLGTLDVNSIDNPQWAQGYTAGDTFTFKLIEALNDKPSQVVWFFDGGEQKNGSVVLTSGSHTVKAHLTFPDGREEDVFLELNVK